MKKPSPSQDAARRFLELHAEIAALEGQDHHHQEFVGCELCQKIQSLELAYKQFRKQFAPAWAKEALRTKEEN